MEITISDARDEDMYRLFEIASMAFGTSQPFWNATWPDHLTHAGREAGARRFRDTKNSDSYAIYMKAIDNASGKIVGVGKWSIFIDHMPDPPHSKESNSEENDDEAKDYQQYLATQFFAERRDAIAMSRGNIVCIDLLAVDPSYQRRGIASALIARATEKADELGLQSVVESSAAGQGVYEKYGFILIKKVQIQVPPKWSHREGQDFAWLVRPAKGEME